MAATTKEQYEKKGWCPLAAAILAGEHDGEKLEQVVRAAQHRAKAVLAQGGVRKGAKVRLSQDPRNRDFRGREGVVAKINKRTVSVDLECEQCGSDKEVAEAVAWGDRCTACHGIPSSVNVPMDLVGAVAA